ncbi:MAG: aminotransferase class V-fold PLP-dependent enzyme, partial [Candidatus Thorarchaeota archaeon]
DPTDVESELSEMTKLICLTHSSNVTGSIQPIHEIGKIARENGIAYLVDAAQSAGVLPIDMLSCGIDMLVFTGHKSLYGPQGTGGVILSDHIVEKLTPLMQGGTGIISDEPNHENLPLPDRFEAGTHNTHGLVGLKAGLDFINQIGIERIHKYEMSLTRRLIEGLYQQRGVTLYGPANSSRRLAVVSFNMDRFSPDELGHILDKSFGVVCRSGLHCAPLAHKRIGSYPLGGTVRFGLGYFNTQEEVESVLGFIEQINNA